MSESVKARPYNDRVELESVIEPVPADATSLGMIPEYLETAIYLYFVVVAAIGLFLHRHIWRGYRRTERSEN
ncbi:hypothetical protein [Halostagnicola sp. A-GB9-2]|uniref:hypothetical protein n=1 Tax=Halostagnicola sp. A-GB9-2 TaxID=3048066 RepID=UPI0024BFE7FB|nr:hypothetical protein [Halostagnicola sp. A-GB9-2]MDJ1431340.1 hypothetical protein [Halostagnicola sp. A-GB9-2]